MRGGGAGSRHGGGSARVNRTAVRSFRVRAGRGVELGRGRAARLLHDGEGVISGQDRARGGRGAHRENNKNTFHIKHYIIRILCT